MITVARDIASLATDDYVFYQGSKALVVHQHQGGEEPHYVHGVNDEIWGRGWIYHHMFGDAHWHQSEIKGRG